MPDSLPPRSVGDRLRSDRGTPPSDTRLSAADGAILAPGGTAAVAAGAGPRALPKTGRKPPPRSADEDLADTPPDPDSLKESLPRAPPEPAPRVGSLPLSGCCLVRPAASAIAEAWAA